MILADTSVWVDYLRSGDPELQMFLLNGQVLLHPCVAAELALGSLRNRHATLAKLDAMPQARVIVLQHIRHMVEERALFSKGIGLTDAHLVASCLITTGMKLWTRDTALKSVAQALGVDAGLP